MSSEDVKTICRTCCTVLSADVKFRAIFKAGRILGNISTLADIISSLFGQLEIIKGDGLPELICENCAIQASKSYGFKQQCFKSNDLLRDKLKIKKESPEPVEKDEEFELLEVEENDEDEEEEEEDEEEEQHEQLQTVYEISCEDHDMLQQQDESEDDCKIEILQDDFAYPVPNEEDIHSDIQNVPKELGEIREKPKETIAFKKSRLTRKKRKPTVENLSFKCKVCEKQLSNAGSFKYHMQLHSDEVPFLCCECGEKFKTKNAYEGHMTTHNNTHTCEVCGKCYRQAASLRSHMLSHTGEKLFLCILCGKSMTQKSGLKKHMLTHSGEKPYHCEICDKDFRFSSNLIMHKRSHTGDRPYECTVCDKKFPGGEQLKRHMMIHTGEKPYSCDFCGRRFNRKSSLRVHTAIHTGEKNHVCGICGKAFIQHHCLVTHMNTHPPMPLPEETISEEIVL